MAVGQHHHPGMQAMLGHGGVEQGAFLRRRAAGIDDEGVAVGVCYEVCILFEGVENQGIDFHDDRFERTAAGPGHWPVMSMICFTMSLTDRSDTSMV